MLPASIEYVAILGLLLREVLAESLLLFEFGERTEDDIVLCTSKSDTLHTSSH